MLVGRSKDAEGAVDCGDDHIIPGFDLEIDRGSCMNDRSSACKQY